MRRIITPRTMPRLLVLLGCSCGLVFTYVEQPASVRAFLDLAGPLLVDWLTGSLVAVTILFGMVTLPGALVEFLAGLRCPCCGDRRFRLVAVEPFGNRYYCCSGCSSRRKRSIIGGWADASGPSDDHAYRAPARRSPWDDERPAADAGSPTTALDTREPSDPAAKPIVATETLGEVPDLPPATPVRVDLLDVLVEEGLIQPGH